MSPKEKIIALETLYAELHDAADLVFNAQCDIEDEYASDVKE